MDKTILLTEQWAALMQDEPGLRIRNAANKLGVSELELLLTKLGKGVVKLRPEFNSILSGIEDIGYVMALTRNEYCVIERKGHYKNGMLNKAHVGVFAGDEIDLRIFYDKWAYAFAVSESTGTGIRHSLHFFCKDGEATHKIYLNEKSNVDAFTSIVNDFSEDDQKAPVDIVPRPLPEEEVNDVLIDSEGLRHEWTSMRDTHEFLPILYKYNVSRTQALRLAPVGGYAVRLPEITLRNILQDVIKEELPVMIFVGNKGTLQIYSGVINSLIDHGEWLNILDPEFNLHLKENSIEQCWLVRKPTLDGIVTSIECYDNSGGQIIQMFGSRKPGVQELTEWRKLVAVYE